MGRLSMEAGNRRAPLAERGHDLYETPEVATRALLSVEAFNKHVWEPAVGRRRMSRVLDDYGYDVRGTDIVDYDTKWQSETQDFLKVDPDWRLAHDIITNPPYKDAHAFVRHALKFRVKVAMLLRLAFYESERRRDILEDAGLARIHCFRKRLPMMHRDGWEGRKANSGMAFARFVWEPGHIGATAIDRISWEPFVAN